MIDPPEFDPQLAADMIGCSLLVGVSYYKANGEFDQARQFFGVVEICDPRAGIRLRDSDGELFTLPPMTAGIEPAEPGEYRMKVSGLVVTDPDFIATFHVTSPD